MDDLNHLLALDLENNDKQYSRTTFSDYYHCPLNVTGNPLPIPEEILRQRYQPIAIIQYYASTYHSPEVPTRALNEAKVILVGQGSLEKRHWQIGCCTIILIYIKKARGIEISDWYLSDGERKFVFMSGISADGDNAFHSSVLRGESYKYIFLFSMLDRMNRKIGLIIGLDHQIFWRRIASYYSGKQADEHPLDIDRIGTQKKYPPVKAIIPASAKTGKGN